MLNTEKQRWHTLALHVEAKADLQEAENVVTRTENVQGKAEDKMLDGHSVTGRGEENFQCSKRIWTSGADS